MGALVIFAIEMLVAGALAMVGLVIVVNGGAWYVLALILAIWLGKPILHGLAAAGEFIYSKITGKGAGKIESAEVKKIILPCQKYGRKLVLATDLYGTRWRVASATGEIIDEREICTPCGFCNKRLY